jgi:hypothetical protein
MGKHIRGRRLLRRGVLGFVLALFASGLSGCGGGERFSYVKVAGKVSYEDGSLIPADRLRVRFIPLAPPLDSKTPPPSGYAEVDPKTGTFTVVTSHTHGDGLVPGKHKVLIQAINGDRLRADLVPAEYTRPEKTPLSVNTDHSPFDLKVRKPVPGKAKGK